MNGHVSNDTVEYENTQLENTHKNIGKLLSLVNLKTSHFHSDLLVSPSLTPVKPLTRETEKKVPYV